MSFINEDFMLSNGYAKELFHESAENLPIIDYHCHLVPKEIADNIQFTDMTQLWLGADHYKWRAMRGNGVTEEYITGDKPSWEKFEKWADTMQYSMRNPLYHWSHLELKRVFGIDTILKPETAREIYDECNAKLATEEFRGQALIRKFNVEAVCTTDDPVDDLRFHKQIMKEPFGTKVLPAWRPDKAAEIGNPAAFCDYVQKLAEAADMDILCYDDLLAALRKRHDYFEKAGCKLSDHGMATFYAEDYTEEEINQIYDRTIDGVVPTEEELDKFRSAMLFELAKMDAESGWVQQFHVGPLRNNNEKMFRLVGPDTGFDAIHDLPLAAAGHKFFSRLALEDKLAKTVLYCLNPKDFEVMAAMAYTFNDGSCPGKMQLGSGWWFLDQEYGMRKQIDTISALGLLSRFVGMLTDSRSFISYPRHEYFRRILCDILGRDLADGKLPVSEMPFIHQMVRDISYFNAKNYFNF